MYVLRSGAGVEPCALSLGPAAACPVTSVWRARMDGAIPSLHRGAPVIERRNRHDPSDIGKGRRTP